MKIRVFQSDKGDCMLLTALTGTNILVDGGMKASYTQFAAATLGGIQTKKGQLDLVYVSHIDEDHISGVLQMMDDLVEWRVHDFQRANGNPSHPAPTSVRPPDVGEIWHNAFHEQLGKNAGPIEDMLAASATILSGATLQRFRELAEASQQLVFSERQAVQLSRRVGKGQLNIPLNPPAQKKLLMVRLNSKKAIKFRGLTISVIGPHPDDLKNLRKKWDTWLKANQKTLKAIQTRAKADEKLLGNAVDRIIVPKVDAAMALGADQLELAKTLGLRSKVTLPNLASLMLLVEEGSKSLLLTGDGHAEDILKGLDHYGKRPTGHLHVDVLKVQHHGSEHNIDKDFCEAVTADHYIFCGNGAHQNPDVDVVDTLIKARLDGPDAKPFKLWFNSSSAVSAQTAHHDHMTRVEKLVRKAATESHGRVKSEFLKKDFFELTL